jgi:hypothetical protein
MLDVGSRENENNLKFIDVIRDEFGITDVSTAVRKCKGRTFGKNACKPKKNGRCPGHPTERLKEEL